MYLTPLFSRRRGIGKYQLVKDDFVETAPSGFLPGGRWEKYAPELLVITVTYPFKGAEAGFHYRT